MKRNADLLEFQLSLYLPSKTVFWTVKTYCFLSPH